MNGKKRWQTAIIFSIIIHILLLIFISHQIPQWLPPSILPPEENTAVFIDDKPLPADDNTGNEENSAAPAPEDTTITIPSKNILPQTAESESAPAEQISPRSEKENSAVDTDSRKNKPKRYRITSLKGVNLASLIDPAHPPAPPQLIKEVPFVPPDELLASPHPVEVEVKYMIEADGSVHADISKSSGSDAVDDAAIKAISAWRYAPMDNPYPIPLPHMFRWPEE
ncbi:energy transducer TonB [Pectinatus haikarae]|uniref:TonB family protein n=1 Tax=Pectinatus haikarae TaxID=349096 RepID=A0ABT9Y7Q1_9FIRM|nr:TonB family protein [Pectinatus haikarae]MDQ0203551.1 TonB family protein [Pectinatus haikarae]